MAYKPSRLLVPSSIATQHEDCLSGVTLGHPWSGNNASPNAEDIRETAQDMRQASRPPFKRRKYTQYGQSGLWFGVLFLYFFVSTASCVFISNYDDCLPDYYLTTEPPHQRLQWRTMWVDATFDRYAPSHHLNVTFYGNVTGQANEGPYPSPNSRQWSDPYDTFGKIVNVSSETNTFTTLSASYTYLTYMPYDKNVTAFCRLANVACPIPPVFGPAHEPSDLPGFSVGRDLDSSFGFTTVVTNVNVHSGDSNDAIIACITANITPALSDTVADILAYIPVAILALVGIAVVVAAMFCEWGSADPFRWTSNYGRDEDLLRLVTPGFGDCLQYIQFIVLTGSLSLAYPGFYQPVVSQASWSALMFNESFVSHGNGTINPIDGIYVTSGDYGLTKMSQLVGMSSDEDLWAGTVVWTLVIILIVMALCQVGFLYRRTQQALANSRAQDLRSKNWPFTGGNLVRIVFNFFFLPIVSLSMFQLVIAPQSSDVVVAFAAILLAAILVFSAWILRLILTTNPRSQLFDELPTVLLYGPLYNTYSDDAAPFALIPMSLTFLRGIAIGAVQRSGIAQLVILAVAEVTLIITIYAFRPFQSPTSMNAIHTIFASVRLITVLLMVAFVTHIGVSEGVKGWIGYVILLLHALILVFGFFLIALQTLIEIVARRAGSGNGPARRGGLVKAFGVRQLSKRQRRPSLRHSQHSTAAMLNDDGEPKIAQQGSRSRSVSASSAIMLNSRRASEARLSTLQDRSLSGNAPEETAYDPTSYSYTPVETSGAAAAKRPDLALKTEPSDPYYRPPRPRRLTGDLMTPGAKSRDQQRASGSGDWPALNMSPESDRRESGLPRTGSGSPKQQVAPAPAYMRAREGSDALPDQNKDYAVREVDYYYGVRGPALSSQPTRKLKTGPADPVGPVSSATGWFKGIFGGKKKESGKGFEVVRSSRMPPPREDDEEEEAVNLSEEPYRDNPTQQQEAYLPGEQTRGYPGGQYLSSTDPTRRDSGGPISDRPPSLDPLDALGGGLGFPSRWSSRVSQKPTIIPVAETSTQEPVPALPHVDSAIVDDDNEALPGVPSVPRKSSRRTASQEKAAPPSRGQLSDIADSPNRNVSRGLEPSRVPFSGSREGSLRRPSAGAESAISDEDVDAQRRGRPGSELLQLPDSNPGRPTSYGYVNQFRASESIQGPYLGGPQAHAGSSAEIIESSPTRQSKDEE